MTAAERWLFTPAPLARVAALRTVVYLFIPVDLLLTTAWVTEHKDVPRSLYTPLVIGRLLHQPAPTHGLVVGVLVALLACSVLAAGGRWPRLLGTVVFGLYAEWMLIAMSYGKVDHDRFAFLVALAALPAVGRARHGDTRRSEAAGWALRVIQIAVVATYFLASMAKLRFGGIEWLNGATLTRAVLRRGSVLSDWTLHVPYLLVAFQYVIVAMELSSPVVFCVRSNRVRYVIVAGWYAFHLMTFAAITIVFLPHCVAILAFLPMERLRPVTMVRRRLAVRTPQPVMAGP